MYPKHPPTKARTHRPAAIRPLAHCLVVINHHEARIFRSDHRGAVSEQVRPQQTDDAISHVYCFNGFSRGQEKPSACSYFGPVAKALAGSGPVLIFGSGTGTANEMEQFIGWARIHRPKLARRIVGTLIIDEHHQTDAQLLKKARAYPMRPAFGRNDRIGKPAPVADKTNKEGHHAQQFRHSL